VENESQMSIWDFPENPGDFENNENVLESDTKSGSNENPENYPDNVLNNNEDDLKLTENNIKNQPEGTKEYTGDRGAGKVPKEEITSINTNMESAKNTKKGMDDEKNNPDEKHEKTPETKIFEIITDENGKKTKRELKISPKQIEKIKIIKAAIEELKGRGRPTGIWEIFNTSQKLAGRMSNGRVKITYYGDIENIFTSKRGKELFPREKRAGNKNIYSWNRNYMIEEPPPPPPEESPTIRTPSGKEIPVSELRRKSDMPPLPGMEEYTTTKNDNLARELYGETNIGEPPEDGPFDPSEFSREDFLPEFGNLEYYGEENIFTLMSAAASRMAPKPPEEPPYEEESGSSKTNPKPKPKSPKEQAKDLQDTLPGIE